MNEREFHATADRLEGELDALLSPEELARIQAGEIGVTKEIAIRMANSGWWKDLPSRTVAAFQLHEPLLCMPFGDFQQAVEEALGRPVFTHELGLSLDGIKKELMGEKVAPTFAEILGLIPREKLAVIVVTP